MLKIIEVKKLHELKNNNEVVYGMLLDIKLSNNDTNTINFFGKSLEEAEKQLYSINWKDKIIEELEESRDNYSNELDEMYIYWNKLLLKVCNNELLDKEDIESINFVMNTGTVFTKFNYETWAI